MDEISPLGCTRVLEVRNGAVSEWSIEPAQFELGSIADDLSGGEPAANAARVIAVLDGSGQEGGAQRRAAERGRRDLRGRSGDLVRRWHLRGVGKRSNAGSALGALAALREASVGG